MTVPPGWGPIRCEPVTSTRMRAPQAIPLSSGWPNSNPRHKSFSSAPATDHTSTEHFSPHLIPFGQQIFSCRRKPHSVGPRIPHPLGPLVSPQPCGAPRCRLHCHTRARYTISSASYFRNTRPLHNRPRHPHVPAPLESPFARDGDYRDISPAAPFGSRERGSEEVLEGYIPGPDRSSSSFPTPTPYLILLQRFSELVRRRLTRARYTSYHCRRVRGDSTTPVDAPISQSLLKRLFGGGYQKEVAPNRSRHHPVVLAWRQDSAPFKHILPIRRRPRIQA
jgi:hypothetical protein